MTFFRFGGQHREDRWVTSDKSAERNLTLFEKGEFLTLFLTMMPQNTYFEAVVIESLKSFKSDVKSGKRLFQSVEVSKNFLKIGVSKLCQIAPRKFVGRDPPPLPMF